MFKEVLNKKGRKREKGGKRRNTSRKHNVALRRGRLAALGT